MRGRNFGGKLPAREALPYGVVAQSWRMIVRFPVLSLTLACLLPMLPMAAQAASPTVTVTKPWMRYLLPSLPAAGYMTLHNSGDTEAVLTAAASPGCGMLMLHKSQDDSGMAMMMDMQSVTIPANGSVTFAPGGYHLMCMQPKLKIGDQLPVTLTFQDGSTLSTTMPVYGAQNAP
jgi:copper(I)-binding protein